MQKLYYIFIFLILNACVAQSVIPPVAPAEEILFGSGGGFAGQINTYKLTADGKVFFNNDQIQVMDSTPVSSLFEQAQQWLSYHFDQPDNMYNFLEIRTKERSNRIVWGMTSTEIDPQLKAFYEKLNTVKSSY
jgi:hypothetical protein